MTARKSAVAAVRHAELLGRAQLLTQVSELLAQGQSVLLCGPEDIGKTALIQALMAGRADGPIVVDPLAHLHSHDAARIRRALERGACHLAATRSLDRAYLGAVRRIAFWFTVVRVPPLTRTVMDHLIDAQCATDGLTPELATPRWRHTVHRLADGRPGRAVAIIRTAAALRGSHGTLPSPEVAYIEVCVRRAGLSDGGAGGPRGALTSPPSER